MSDLVLSAVNLHAIAKYGNFDEKQVETPDRSNQISSKSTANKLMTSVKNENKLNSSATKRQQFSPKNSIDSNNISIVTLDENEIDSSVIDSDSESDANDAINCNKYRSSIDTVLVNKDLQLQNNCEASDLWTNDEVKANIGSICIQNSSDITIGGDKRVKVYQGPVTINQYVHDSGTIGKRLSSTNNLSQNEKDFSIVKDHSKLIRKLQNKWKWTRKQVIITTIAGGLFTCFMFAMITVISVFSGGNKSSISSSLQIVSRKDWGAEPPKVELEKLSLPVNRLIVHHTGVHYCTTRDECIQLVQYIQKFHKYHKGWDDIGYNFLVGGDGAVYVGRGWNHQGAHTIGHNSDSICIAFIGRFNDITPPLRQLNAAQKLIEEGIELEKLSTNYNLYGHCQLGTHASPGPALMRIIKTWKRWTNNPIGICES